jgi:hypothetical protein
VEGRYGLKEIFQKKMIYVQEMLKEIIYTGKYGLMV